MLHYHTKILNTQRIFLCREIARMLADEHMKRVVIVDTSNEIGGDGDVPHSGIGRARRMQVSNVNMQHNVSFDFKPFSFFIVISLSLDGCSHLSLNFFLFCLIAAGHD